MFNLPLEVLHISTWNLVRWCVVSWLIIKYSPHIWSIVALQAILGKLVRRPAVLDQELIQELVDTARDEDEFKVVCGKTMCTLDFYEGNKEL